MKKKLLLLMSVFLTLMMLTSCSNSPVIPKVKEPENTEQKATEPIGEILSLSEAQGLLNELSDLYTIVYAPELNKKEKNIQLYGFLIDPDEENPVDPYCYVWVNSSTGEIRFEEAGYSKTEGPNWYGNIPDSTFPIPMRGGKIIHYDTFLPPDHVWGVAYMYKDKSVMTSYQNQLKKAGFKDHGEVQSVESLWQYEGDEDEGIFTVEMYSDGEMFSMTMYVN